MDLLPFILLGLLIGCFSGFFGIGGGIILTPFLLLLGFPPTMVIGTSLMLSLGTSITGAFAHLRMKNIKWRYVIIINIFGIVGTQISHPIMLQLDDRGFAETAISFLYVALLGFFAYTLLRKTHNKSQVENRTQAPTFMICLIGLGTGIISSALGVSGGFFIVPLLITLLHFQAAHAVGTALASVVFIVATGLITYSFSTELNYLVGIFLIIGTFIGAPLGAKATIYYSEKKMKKLLGALYVCMIASVIANAIQLPIVGLTIISAFTLFFITLLIMTYSKRAVRSNTKIEE
ncbi:sulfite exporter TauE/SafE family protein [Halalkalibacter krulwichiae]|uniref:Probable membrane transporter protein n=1 Tax=Halalkalibacter krulwichiae TaxID=199441 RepID=A0A1X9M7M9_9BACI|nr:sulfite exporter TauE/SafE family protein [Halalkalibacter krulwichiae]ARK29416.1 hypothetical protein BkAM31D_05875 [Halalkalibacter krulwichiae]